MAIRVDFYHLTRDPAEAVVPLIAGKIVAAGRRALVVAEADRRALLSAALWNAEPSSFLAHGDVADEAADPALQPILLSAEMAPANSADHVILADGAWREPGEAFERVFLLFAPEQAEAARGIWRTLGERPDVTRHYWKQTDRGWIEAG